MTTETSPDLRIARLRYAGNEAFVAESPSGHAIVTGFSHDALSSPTPMELILIALGGCAGADVVGILQKKRQVVTRYEIEVRGLRREEHPRIYTRIEVVHRVYGRNVDPKAVERAVELSETKYCSVAAMLRSGTDLASRCEVFEEQ
ncbi:MAG: OsmC family protein [Acidobacteria bacterium]|nr:OsmC family protein [Acidobacteriota bacterium]